MNSDFYKTGDVSISNTQHQNEVKVKNSQIYPDQSAGYWPITKSGTNMPVVIRGGEEIPAGGWRGGEEIPSGGWRGGEEIPSGGWRRNKFLNWFNKVFISIGGCLAPIFSNYAINKIPGGIFLSYIQDVYRTEDGSSYFEFGFYWTGQYFEVDIIDMPSYAGKSESLHNTHRLPSDRGGYKICFGNPGIVNNIEVAKRWAGVWAEATLSYIQRNKTFPNN